MNKDLEESYQKNKMRTPSFYVFYLYLEYLVGQLSDAVDALIQVNQIRDRVVDVSENLGQILYEVLQIFNRLSIHSVQAGLPEYIDENEGEAHPVKVLETVVVLEQLASRRVDARPCIYIHHVPVWKKVIDWGGAHLKLTL